MTEQMIQLQKNDSEARKIVHKLHKEKLNTKMYILHEGVLCRLWTDKRETFRCIFIPEVLRDPLLILVHNQNGHNGLFIRTFFTSIVFVKGKINI